MTKTTKYIIGGTAVALTAWLLFFRGTTTGDGIDPTGNGSGGDNHGFDAQRVAYDLWTAMKDTGTDEDLVVSILTPISAAQFELVFQAFGKLNYNRLTGNQYFLPLQTPEKVDLKGWLYEELGASEYANLKRKYPNRL